MPNSYLLFSKLEYLDFLMTSTVKRIRANYVWGYVQGVEEEAKATGGRKEGHFQGVGQETPEAYFIDKDPINSTCKLAKEMNCSNTTIQYSLQEDLKSRSYRCQTGQFLSQALIDKRLLKCTKLLNMLRHPKEQEMKSAQ